MSYELTLDQFERVLPRKMKGCANQVMLDKINSTMTNDHLREVFRENLLGFSTVLNSGRYPLRLYVDAVRYTSYKLLGNSNIKSFVMAFPDRYQSWIDSDTSTKDIGSYISAYNKTKIIVAIKEQSLVPTYILNADLYQKAINIQAELMVSANSEKVRTDAANSLLSHLKAPEVTKIELDIGVKEDDSLKDLRKATMELVAQQRLMVASGAISVVDVAESNLVLEHKEGGE